MGESSGGFSWVSWELESPCSLKWYIFWLSWVFIIRRAFCWKLGATVLLAWCGVLWLWAWNQGKWASAVMQYIDLVAMVAQGMFSGPRDQTCVPCVGRWFLSTGPPGSQRILAPDGCSLVTFLLSFPLCIYLCSFCKMINITEHVGVQQHLVVNLSMSFTHPHQHSNPSKLRHLYPVPFYGWKWWLWWSDPRLAACVFWPLTTLQQLAVFSQSGYRAVSDLAYCGNATSSFTAASGAPNKGGKVERVLPPWPHWDPNSMPPGLQGWGLTRAWGMVVFRYVC